MVDTNILSELSAAWACPLAVWQMIAAGAGAALAVAVVFLVLQAWERRSHSEPSGTGDLEEKLRALTQENSRLMSVLEGVDSGVIVVDAERRIAFANEAAGEMLGAPSAVVGEPVAYALSDERLVEALRSDSVGDRRGIVVERPNGRALEVTVTTVSGSGGRRDERLISLRDITAERRSERTRREFVANVSHELRTPLASLKSVVDTLAAGAAEDKTASADFLRRADTEIDRLVTMVAELLELSRLESGEAPLARQPVDVSAVLEQAVERLRPQAEKEKLTLGQSVAADLPKVTGDAERLERVAVSLIDNAIKFTPPGGSIVVEARREAGRLVVEVKDTGVGIDAKDLPHVFERFYKVERSRGSGGTGLGLAIVKHTVEAHGGEVTVNSRLGEGSTFSFSIPLK